MAILNQNVAAIRQPTISGYSLLCEASVKQWYKDLWSRNREINANAWLDLKAARLAPQSVPLLEAVAFRLGKQPVEILQMIEQEARAGRKPVRHDLPEHYRTKLGRPPKAA